MHEQQCGKQQEFERFKAQKIANIALRLGGAAMQFARVERVPRYDLESRENDAEHSFMLSLVAVEIVAQFYPELDAGLVAQFANVHDLVELETGDVATFSLSEVQLADKEAFEHAALDQLVSKLPAHTASLVMRYEAQAEPEARLVRLIDKKLPVVVDILGPGNKVMNEDYGVVTGEALDATEAALSTRFKNKFPEPQLAVLHQARDILAEHFSYVFAENEQLAAGV